MKNIFISCFAFDEGKSGISNYIENTLYHLAEDNNLFVVILKKDIENYTRKHKNIHFLPMPNILEKPILNMIFHLFILPFFITKKYDFIFLPAGNRRLMSFYPIYTIATFHDLSQYSIKGKYSFLRTFYIKKIIPFFLKPVDKIIAVSQNTKDDLIKYFDIKDNKIIVNYNGFDKSLFESVEHDKITMKIRFHIEKEYLLYTARIEHPGKNHLNLIKAYELLPHDLKERFDLVFVGVAKENAQVVFDYVNKSSDRKNIKFLGFISNENLPLIYANATLFIFPSFYEGFGIPLVEAMAMKLPVLSAANSSLLEIGEDVAYYFDEYDPRSIKDAIIYIANNKEKQTIMIKNGLEKLNKFDWRSHGNKIIEECKH